MLTCYGHPNVRVLDGGFNKWKADGGEIGQISVATADDYAYDLVSELVAGYDEVKQISSNKSVQLIDSRPPSMYTAGAIPNSVNVDSATLQNADGTMKS